MIHTSSETGGTKENEKDIVLDIQTSQCVCSGTKKLYDLATKQDVPCTNCL